MLLIHALALCLFVACAHISVVVFVVFALSARDLIFPKRRFYKFYILSSNKRSSIFELKRPRSRARAHTERKREQNISHLYNLRGRVYLVFSSF